MNPSPTYSPSLRPEGPNEQLRFDLEADGFNELAIDAKGRIIKEATTIHCMWVQDLYDRSLTLYKGDNLIEGVKRLWAAKVVRGHNIMQYDIPIIERLTGLKKPATCRVDDSLIRSRLLWPEAYTAPMGGNDLEQWGRWLVKQGKLSCGKGEFKGPWDRWSQEMEDYCKQDVLVHEAIEEYLAKIPQIESVVRLEHAVSAIIARQTANGWCFDRASAERMIAEFDIKRAELMDKLNEAFPPSVETLKTPQYYQVVTKTGKVVVQAETKGATERLFKEFLRSKNLKPWQVTAEIKPGPMRTKLHPFNPSSPDQIVERLRAKYSWEPEEFTDAGNAKADYDVLVQLDYPEVKLLLEYGDVDKMLEMLMDYERRAAASRDGKIHGTINTQGAVTGRMTHKQPNTGNVPKAEKDKDGNYKGVSWKIRTLFLPRPGWVEVGCDASSLEDRMLRNRLGKFDPKELVLSKEDLHTANMNILRQAVPEITRDGAKTFWYGILYGAGDKKAGKIVKKGRDVGKRMKEMFFRGRPNLGKLIEWCKYQAKHTGKLKLLDGRYVPCRAEHSSLNTQLQGDGAVVMKVALVLFDTALQREGFVPGQDYEFVGNIHDEFQLECRPEIAERVGKLGVWSIEESGRRLNVKVPLNGEYKIGKSWAETH